MKYWIVFDEFLDIADDDITMVMMKRMRKGMTKKQQMNITKEDYLSSIYPQADVVLEFILQLYCFLLDKVATTTQASQLQSSSLQKHFRNTRGHYSSQQMKRGDGGGIVLRLLLA